MTNLLWCPKDQECRLEQGCSNFERFDFAYIYYTGEWTARPFDPLRDSSYTGLFGLSRADSVKYASSGVVIYLPPLRIETDRVHDEYPPKRYDSYEYGYVFISREGLFCSYDASDSDTCYGISYGMTEKGLHVLGLMPPSPIVTHKRSWLRRKLGVPGITCSFNHDEYWFLSNVR